MTYADEHWKACPEGELTRLGSRLRGRRRRRVAVRAGGVLAILLVFAGLWAFQARDRDYHFAGISCTRVVELAMAYKEGTLDPDHSTQVRSHIDQCPRCQKRFKEMGMLSLLLPETWMLLASAAPSAADEKAHGHGHRAGPG